MVKKSRRSNAKIMVWSWHGMCCGHSSFLARLIFAGLAVWILSMKGIIFDGVSWWILALLVLAFAMMKKGHCNCNCCK